MLKALVIFKFDDSADFAKPLDVAKAKLHQQSLTVADHKNVSVLGVVNSSPVITPHRLELQY